METIVSPTYLRLKKMQPLIDIAANRRIPIILAIIIATSQLTSRRSAKPPKKHRAGGSEPSSGTTLDNQTMADLFRSSVPPTISPLTSETLG